MPSHHAIRNVPEYVLHRFDNALEQATERLRAGAYEANLEVKKQQTASTNTINVHGPNYGNIQQDGLNNKQRMTRTKKSK